ncbi:BcsR/BcsP family cellulose biosynthesis protein [Variovorax sp. 38R]|uniref:BcsR/BcsP family cellulose biosynthesis protein n=1 Tax=Variovorax sp. 38R TaxID=2774875 RepID=UPI0017836925|nr:BcsR/BcsP family cellulose biosynthesis protein [Variovorax sp. 38R]QOF76532.1 hypothetical protein IG196_19420 [Variovorax sp. 38R]
MNRDDRSAEDVAGLFRKFGGDAHAYKEFEPPEAQAQAASPWPLLSGGPIDRTPMAAPARSPIPPVAPLFPAAAAPQPVPTPAAGPAPNELQALFARLAEPACTPAPPGPMSRWRRPT